MIKYVLYINHETSSSKQQTLTWAQHARKVINIFHADSGIKNTVNGPVPNHFYVKAYSK